MIKTKCVYSPIDPAADGLRILATRYRGRGLKKSRYDVWMANLGPSEPLVNGYQADRISWPDFARRYRREIFESASTDRGNAVIKNHGQKFTLRLIKHLARHQNVTLLCHCSEDRRECHRHLLKKLIESNRV